MDCYAACAPGLEGYLQAELAQLGLPVDQVEPGGAAFQTEIEGLYCANLSLRIANKVLVRVGQFYASAFSELRKKAARLPWELYLRAGQPLSVRAVCHHSRLYHSDGVAQRVAGAIGDRLGQPSILLKADDEAPVAAQQVLARLLNDQCTLSIDSSGELLHRRGYRLASAKAPLRETLAAGMLAASGWDASRPLLDPFCGSGTLAIEAAMQAAGIAPGRARPFAFMEWPAFDAPAWNRLLEQAQSASQARLTNLPLIRASDRDAGAIQSAQANAERAGVAGWITYTCQAVSHLQPPAQTGWIVTNPPYGQRLRGGQDLRNLYAQFGNTLRRVCPGWRIAVLSNDKALLGQMKIKLDSSVTFVNGGIRVYLGRGVVPDK